MADLSTPEGKLVERLRAQAQFIRVQSYEASDLFNEAADALSRIAAERDEAKERAINNWRNMQRLWDLAQGWDPDDNEEGPRCRDCADEDGRCPHSGYPCDPQEEAEERIGKLFARASAAERERDELKAEVERLTQALKPFAEPLDNLERYASDRPDDFLVDRRLLGSLNLGAFRTARAALRTPEESL